MTRLDLIALGLVCITAFAGFKRGLVMTAVSLGGMVLGAVLGARVAPHLVAGSAYSTWTPVVSLVGAAFGAVLFQTLASSVGGIARGGLSALPPLRAVDSVGGLLVGAAWGLALVWIVTAAVLQLPEQPDARREIQRSALLPWLTDLVPPEDLLRVLRRFDPFPSVSGPPLPTLAPDPRMIAKPGVRRARAGVLRITANACGLVEGSGWVARPQLVVTAAHVVAGGSDIRVDGRGAEAWFLDRGNDVAVLHVPGLVARPLPFADPQPGTPVAILGYPQNGPFDARAGRLGQTASVVIEGNLRSVTALSGLVRPGNSGGPAVDATGTVRTTVFAERPPSGGGYGIPAAAVRRALARATRLVSTGEC